MFWRRVVQRLILRGIAAILFATALSLCIVQASCIAPASEQAAGPVDEPTGPWREQIHWVPMQDESGTQRLLYTRICRPRGDAPARVVLIDHGKPYNDKIPQVKPASCTNEAVQWFLQRGFLVVAGVRRGYGQTGGRFLESIGSCGAADLRKAALAGARDVDALLRYALSLPYADKLPGIVVGLSVGGWVSLGYNSVPHPLAAAIVSMAGGHGGHINGLSNNNCRTDQLALAVGQMGQTATTPMLWVYAANDTYFGPALARDLYDHYTASGALVDFHQLPPYGADGHELFFGRGGSAIWGPLMVHYLSTLGITVPE